MHHRSSCDRRTCRGSWRHVSRAVSAGAIRGREVDGLSFVGHAAPAPGVGQAQRRGVRHLRQAVGKRRGHGTALSLLSVALKVLAVATLVQTLERKLGKTSLAPPPRLGVAQQMIRASPSTTDDGTRDLPYPKRTVVAPRSYRVGERFRAPKWRGPQGLPAPARPPVPPLGPPTRVGVDKGNHERQVQRREPPWSIHVPTEVLAIVVDRVGSGATGVAAVAEGFPPLPVALMVAAHAAVSALLGR